MYRLMGTGGRGGQQSGRFFHDDEFEHHHIIARLSILKYLIVFNYRGNVRD